MLIKAIPLGIGDFVPNIEHQFWNRTGATLTKGQVAMVDLIGTQAESTSIIPGADGSCFGNLTPVTQASLENGFPIVVCLDDSVADNALGKFGMVGVFPVSVLDDDVSTTDIDRGDPISMVVSESAVSVQAFANGDRCLGIALADAAASSSGTASLKSCIWYGGVPCFGMNLDA